MSKSRQSNATAKALVSPMFAWTNALIKGGEMMLDSMRVAIRNSRSLAVLPDVAAAARSPSKPRKAKARPKASSRRAKGRRRR